MWEWKTLEDDPLLEVRDWEWKFENGEAVLIMTHQVISFHYSPCRGAILFLVFYGSLCILIVIIGSGIALLLF